MSILSNLDWNAIRDHYDQRVDVHLEMERLYKTAKKSKSQFADLALGISDPAGNYSADRYKFGPAILEANKYMGSYQAVYNLAGKFIPVTDAAKEVPALIRKANLKYLAISVGSEIACMMNPRNCWVGNARTVFAYIGWDQGLDKAVEAHDLFANRGPGSEADYSLWEEYYPFLGKALSEIAAEGARLARQENALPGDIIPFLWADAIASAAYDCYALRKA